MPFGDSDLGAFFDPNGMADAVVQYQGATAAGILDVATDVYMHGDGPAGFQRSVVSLKIAFNAFPATPKPQDSITVNGTAYTVRELPEQRDRAITELYLKLA